MINIAILKQHTQYFFWKLKVVEAIIPEVRWCFAKMITYEYK